MSDKKKTQPASLVSLRPQGTGEEETKVFSALESMEDFFKQAAEVAKSETQSDPETCVARVSSLDSFSSSGKPLAIRSEEKEGEEDKESEFQSNVTPFKPRNT